MCIQIQINVAEQFLSTQKLFSTTKNKYLKSSILTRSSLGLILQLSIQTSTSIFFVSLFKRPRHLIWFIRLYCPKRSESASINKVIPRTIKLLSKDIAERRLPYLPGKNSKLKCINHLVQAKNLAGWTSIKTRKLRRNLTKSLKKRSVYST